MDEVTICVNTFPEMDGGRAAVFEIAGEYNLGQPYTQGDVLMNQEIANGTAEITVPYPGHDRWVIIRVRKAGYIPFETIGRVTQDGLVMYVPCKVDGVYEKNNP